MSTSILQIIKSLELICAKKTLKKQNIREIRPFWKSAIVERLWPMQNPGPGSKIKIPKNMSKSILQIHLELFCPRNRSKKHEIFKIWDHFENRPSSKGYSPWKILTLGQKIKFQKTCQNPFYKSFRVVLCKKPLEKTLNIREMRPFWKSAIMQRL